MIKKLSHIENNLSWKFDFAVEFLILNYQILLLFKYQENIVLIIYNQIKYNKTEGRSEEKNPSFIRSN